MSEFLKAPDSPQSFSIEGNSPVVQKSSDNSPNFRRTRHLGAVAGVAMAGFMAAQSEQANADSRERIIDERPNIVFILTDDQDLASQKYMPKTKKLLEDRGTKFENFVVDYSLCCPSRATLLRGQYAHNTGIEGNVPPWGGWEGFKKLEQSTIATWLEAAGYYTAYLGKYFNGYKTEDGHVPRGWKFWAATDDRGYHNRYKYPMSINGEEVWFDGVEKEEDYLTDVLAKYSVEQIEMASKEDKPFAIFIAPTAPHAPAECAPRHSENFKIVSYEGKEYSIEIPGNFMHRDESKPDFVKEMEREEWWELEYADRIEDTPREKERVKHARDRVCSLQAVDDLVEAVVNALEDTGELKKTYVAITTDNGFKPWGEHGFTFYKTTAYGTAEYGGDIHVPFIMRGPGIAEGSVISSMGLNNDIAPTFAEIAGIEVPPWVDGRSLIPVINNPDEAEDRCVYIQRKGDEKQRHGPKYEIDALYCMDKSGEYYDKIIFVDDSRDDKIEHYDENDPYEKDGGGGDPAIIQVMFEKMKELSECEGRGSKECRMLERPPADLVEHWNKKKAA